MTKEQELFILIGRRIEGSELSNLFGKPCFKLNGKAFICFFENDMVFKLTGEVHKKAMGLDGSKLFDPSGKKRPMKKWVQVPYSTKHYWEEFAQGAIQYLTTK